MSTKTRQRWIGPAMLVIGTALGCEGGGATAPQTPTLPESAGPRAGGAADSEHDDSTVEQPVVSATAYRTLLATVQLSDTHQVQFWEYEDGERMVTETLHADRDFGHHPGLREVIDRPNMTAADVYEALTGADNGELVLAKGRDENPLLPVEHTEQPAAEHEHAHAHEDLVEKGHAVCSSQIESSWNWSADHAWWRDNFCTSSPDAPSGFNKKCQSLVASSAWGFDRTNHWIWVHALAQSHCRTARFIMRKRIHASGWSGGIVESVAYDFNIAPRHIGTVWRDPNGSTVDYRVEVSSRPGSGTARVGLAVHEN